MSTSRVLTSALVCGLFLMSGSRLFAQPPQSQQPQPAAAKAFLGVMVAPAKDADKGILVRAVVADSPAEKAGVKNGDILRMVDDQKVQDVDQSLALIAAKKTGDKVTIHVFRDGKEQTLTATLGEAPHAPTEQRQQQGPVLGLRAEELTAAQKSRLKVTADTGVVIMEVTPDSPAAKAGLKLDDVITTVDGKAVKNPEELHKAIQSAGPGKEVTIELFRGKDKMTVKATPREG